MEKKLPNTIEKLVNKQKKIKYVRKRTILLFLTLSILLIIILIVLAILLGGAI